jgi:hypothetical protein
MDRNLIPRKTQRHEVRVYGRFRYNGRGYDIPLRDLSETGCRFFDRHGHLQEGTAIHLTVGGMGPFDATVRWREGQYVGVQFDVPIYKPVLDHIVANSRKER